MSGEGLRLPTCSIQAPACGACGGETDHDGDSFYCDDCGLDYGDGREDVPAEYRDEDAEPCGKPCGNEWHKPHALGNGWVFTCESCKLPEGHTSMCWTDCEVVADA